MFSGQKILFLSQRFSGQSFWPRAAGFPQNYHGLSPILPPPADFPLYFPKEMTKIPKIFRLRRIFLCISLRKMIKISKIFRLRRIPLCISLRKWQNRKYSASGGFSFVSPEENLGNKNFPPPVDFPLCFPKENNQITNFPPPADFSFVFP